MKHVNKQVWKANIFLSLTERYQGEGDEKRSGGGGLPALFEKWTLLLAIVEPLGKVQMRPNPVYNAHPDPYTYKKSHTYSENRYQRRFDYEITHVLEFEA